MENSLAYETCDLGVCVCLQDSMQILSATKKFGHTTERSNVWIDISNYDTLYRRTNCLFPSVK